MFSFLIVGRTRLHTLLRFFSAQSFLLVLFAVVAAQMLGEPHLLITAFITLVIKVWFIPWWLYRTAVRGEMSMRLQTYLRPASSSLVAAGMIVLGFLLTRSLVPVMDPAYFITAVSLSIVFMGFWLLIVRKGLYGQMVGFLVMENGIFIFGLALTGGMPLLVELGIFFDVMIGSLLMAALSYRVQKEHATVETERLSELVD